VSKSLQVFDSGRRKHQGVFLLLKKYHSGVSQAPGIFEPAVSQAPLSHLQRIINEPKSKKNPNGPKTFLMGPGGAVKKT